MKMKTLSVLAGLSAPLIATTVANSAFVGFKVVQKLDGGSAPTFYGNPIFVCNVYAEFDNAGNDYRWQRSARRGCGNAGASQDGLPGTAFLAPYRTKDS